MEIDEEDKPINIIVSGPDIVDKKKMYRYDYIGQLTMMYSAKHFGLIQIKDIKKNNDYAMWLKVCQKANCYLLDESLAKYRRGRSGSVSSHNTWKMIKWHYLLFRCADAQNVACSCINTFRNMLFGFYKKIHFIKRID